ncbi:MAG: glucokinase [Planctomycetota bacterium]|nr:glucokinase [Planctomycetota bacterium]
MSPGGIAPRIAPAMSSDAFREAFRNKRRFASLMERIPIRLVTNLDAPLLGAAMSGGRLFESPPPPASLPDGADMLRAGTTARYRDDLLKSRESDPVPDATSGCKSGRIFLAAVKT